MQRNLASGQQDMYPGVSHETRVCLSPKALAGNDKMKEKKAPAFFFIMYYGSEAASEVQMIGTPCTNDLDLKRKAEKSNSTI